MSTFRIISFDGGGVRGALSTRILKRLCLKYPSLLNQTDLFAGTSTGALIALSLAYGIDINDVDTIYSPVNMKPIFRYPHFNILRPKYENKQLNKVITSLIPEDCTIGQLKKYVFIPSFNVKGFSENYWDPVFFNNLSRNSTYNIKVVDAALASSAAPTYFPSHNNFIDGGVLVNSPSIASVIMTMKTLKPRHNLYDFKVLSIGTGRTLEKIEENTDKWGAAQWISSPFSKVKTPLISILLNDSTLSDIYCHELLGNNYFRINPVLKFKSPLDDYKQAPQLKISADKLDLSAAEHYIENIYLK